MNILQLNENPIFMWGDNHGFWYKLIELISFHKLTDLNFIQVGDFGVGFKSFETENGLLNELTTLLNSTGCKLYAIRGNHDDPSYFGIGTGKSIVRYNPAIYFLEDYTVLQRENLNILCIGGAISIDRKPRKESNFKNQILGFPNRSWWKKEKFVYDGDKLREVLDSVTVDVVVTHNAPLIFPPYDADTPLVDSYARMDATLKTELEEERNLITKVYDMMYLAGQEPKKWFYGHFHNDETTIYKGTEGIMLGIDEFKDLRM